MQLTRLVSAQDTPEYVVPKSIETIILLFSILGFEVTKDERTEIATQGLMRVDCHQRFAYKLVSCCCGGLVE